MYHIIFLVSFKFSPLDPGSIPLTYDVLPCDSMVTLINTFPNAYGAGILAGMSGKALKPIALGQVKQWASIENKYCDGDLNIIGAGGISTGQDVMDYLNAGAKAVQINTAYSDTGDIGVFTKILEEYAELCE